MSENQSPLLTDTYEGYCEWLKIVGVLAGLPYGRRVAKEIAMSFYD